MDGNRHGSLLGEEWIEQESFSGFRDFAAARYGAGTNSKTDLRRLQTSPPTMPQARADDPGQSIVLRRSINN
jgi:hypothetical protein